MNLSSRLESIQEKILNLYESQSDDIGDQIKYWDLTRQEQVLMHYARQNGHKSLASVQLPSLAASESRAKSAIEMVLILRSLADSPYGREPWTMQQCSRERLLAPPAYCFKKNGGPVTVQFDDDPANAVEFTSWETIYYQNGDNEWHKVQGDVDIDGLFYVQDDGLRVDYVDFAQEAKRYSTTGKYSLLYNNNVVTSIDSQQADSSPEGPLYSSSPRPGSRAAPRDTSPAPRPRSANRSRSRSPQRKRRQTGQQPERDRNLDRGRRGSSAIHSRPLSLLQEASSGRLVRGRAQQHSAASAGKRGGGRGESRSPAPPSPEEVGQIHTTTPRRSTGRLGRLLLEARDPPGICITGPPNNLKCTRYQLKKQHQNLFDLISTTWHWTESKGISRVGNARMLVTFKDTQQRDQFIKRVSLPKSLQFFLVSLGGV